MTSPLAVFARTAAAAVLAIGLAGGASAEYCRNATDCVATPNGAPTVNQPSGCWEPTCKNAGGVTCTSSGPIDYTCSCSYTAWDDGSQCGHTPSLPCGVCQAGLCVSDDVDGDHVCSPDDVCPEIPNADADVDGDKHGDVCDAEDVHHPTQAVKKFQVNASTKDVLTGGLRANGKLSAKGKTYRDDTRWQKLVTEVAVVVTSGNPDTPFDHRWILPCSRTSPFSTSLTCQTPVVRGAPYVRFKIKTNNYEMQWDLMAKNLTIPVVPSLAIKTRAALPSIDIVVQDRDKLFPLEDYLTPPTPITGVDHVADNIGWEPEGWRCLPPTPTRLSCTRR